MKKIKLKKIMMKKIKLKNKNKMKSETKKSLKREVFFEKLESPLLHFNRETIKKDSSWKKKLEKNKKK